MSQMWSLGLLFFVTGASYEPSALGTLDTTPSFGASMVPPENKQDDPAQKEIKTDQTIHASNYNGMRKTRFIIPGYLEKGDEDWTHDLCKVILTWENINCIAVEWKKGVKTLYAQAANNARVVSAQVASMITFLMGDFKQKADKFNIIGHSLGAHVAGDVGSRITGLTRITGLDPAEPYFQDTNTSVHLDTSDAAFVDVIHTDGLPFNSKLGLGMSQSVGHIDFYPNGGELMPGCSANKGNPTDLDAMWEGTKKFDACSHVRAYQYYRESVGKSQGFVGFPCSDKDSFAAGKCFPCVDNKCPLMGHHADKFTVTDGISKMKYFLNTGSSKPFGRYRFRVLVSLDGPSWPNPGFMFVAFARNTESTKEYQLHVGTMTPGRTYEMLIDAEMDLGDVTEVKFRWNNHILNPLRPMYGASKVELQRGKDNKM
ncbi:hypothetical protein L3Q82_011563 [Scortum barcoo]|uniref:Uncharacterized protein n=1 Tax=Scortum barcoo TaxID=214431 RepID=A0ACB8W745_9TELE|nr:hypothetical protein L3Q82_011563 [Scortum barcoo]